jgi:hypothetical protein
MAPTAKKKILASAFLLLVIGLMVQSCLRAGWYHAKLRPGMTVREVFSAVDGWFMCNGNSQRPPTEPYLLFWANPGEGGTYTIHVAGQTGDQQIGSKEDLINTLQQQMSDGHAWHISFTWSGIPRSSFLVSFDAHGRVEKIWGIAGNN